MKIKLANELPAVTEPNTLYIVPEGANNIAIHVSGKDNVVKKTVSVEDIAPQSTNKAHQFFMASS